MCQEWLYLRFITAARARTMSPSTQRGLGRYFFFLRILLGLSLSQMLLVIIFLACACVRKCCVASLLLCDERNRVLCVRACSLACGRVRDMCPWYVCACMSREA